MTWGNDDDGQGDLFGGLPPFERDSETSRAAALSQIGVTGKMRTRVLKLLREYGAAGLIDEQIGEILDMGLNTVRPRRRELVLLHLVVDSGRQRLTRSARRATVWIPASDLPDPPEEFQEVGQVQLLHLAPGED